MTKAFIILCEYQKSFPPNISWDLGIRECSLLQQLLWALTSAPVPRRISSVHFLQCSSFNCRLVPPACFSSLDSKGKRFLSCLHNLPSELTLCPSVLSSSNTKIWFSEYKWTCETIRSKFINHWWNDPWKFDIKLVFVRLQKPSGDSSVP